MLHTIEAEFIEDNVSPLPTSSSTFKLDRSKSFSVVRCFSDIFAPSANKYFMCSIRFQDGLRRRMDKLKSSIEEGNRAVDKEREKNVSLLHLIFPPDIAKRLWLGETTFCDIL